MTDDPDEPWPDTQGLVTVDRATERYTLQGVTAADLARDLLLQRPRGEHFTGWTQWRLRWAFEPHNGPDGCEVGAVDVNLNITQVLPSWAPPERADPDLVERWDVYLYALEEHEDYHARLAVQTAQRLQRVLEALPAQPNCTQTRREANRSGDAQVADLRRANHLYDSVTGHGAAQGAIFPSSGTVAHPRNES